MTFTIFQLASIITISLLLLGFIHTHRMKKESNKHTGRQQKLELELNAEIALAKEGLSRYIQEIEEYKKGERSLKQKLEHMSEITQAKNIEAAKLEEKVTQIQKLNESHENVVAASNALKTENSDIKEQTAKYRDRCSSLAEQLNELKATIASKDRDINSKNDELKHIQSQLSGINQKANSERKALEDQIALLNSSEQRLTEQFENLANKIFDQKAQTLKTQSKESLESTLSPFKTALNDFKTQVQNGYQHEALERRSLKQEIVSLKELNHTMTQEASNLTSALKGDNKAQGTWGEMILETILQQSGLRQGHEYDIQSTHRDEEGSIRKPDVIVHLPDSKDVVIDSKVVLKHYEQYCSSESDAEREIALRGHKAALRNHVKLLSEKRYEDLKGVKALDYVLMFIPIEPALHLALQQDGSLFEDALDKNIMLVSPANLHVALRTIQNIWRYEHQTQNAQQIATKAAALYDKFVGFVDDMNKIGRGINQVGSAYNDACKKLSDGRGNLTNQAKAFLDLGIKPKKQLPELEHSYRAPECLSLEQDSQTKPQPAAI